MNNSKPAYLIASLKLPKGHQDLTNYAQAAMPIFQNYGAKILVVGTSDQNLDLLEGEWSNPDAKLSIVQFPSMQDLKNCMESAEYVATKHLRTDIIDSNFSLAVS